MANIDFTTSSARNITNRSSIENNENYVGAAIHPLFGLVQTIPGGYTVMTPDVLSEQYRDYVPRELGISKQILKNNRVLRGLSNPGTYLNDKNANLKQIANSLGDAYKVEYGKLYNRGYSPEEAKHKALKYVKMLEEFMLKEHNDEFPTDLTNNLVGKLKKIKDTKITVGNDFY